MNIENVTVSVIIPSFNYGHFIGECIDSVLMQEGVKLELIVVDDGSTDNTEEIVGCYGRKVNYIYQENSGLSSARNTGIENSCGDYVQFLDADDLLEKNCLLEKLLAIKALRKKSIIVSKSYYFDVVNESKINKVGQWYLYSEGLNVHLCRLNIAPPHAFFLPREIFDLVGNFDESFKGCEDYDFWLRALGAGYNFFSCKKAVVYYRLHINSMGKEKAAKGEFPFDVSVHEKKLLGKYGRGVQDLLKSFDGLIAFTDGVLRTALMISIEANPSGVSKMLAIAEKNLSTAIQILNSDTKVTITTTLYVWRLYLLTVRMNGGEMAKVRALVLALYAEYRINFSLFSDIKKICPLSRFEQKSLLSAMLKSALYV